ncbi:hypothetical protein DL237_00250 [Pseudooceanicola sediminis]|uniref:Antifreeze glycopeptide polyprotein n=1 Tax=Pseudooceanicola sediminis TaxID=2211117 RepID=A0A399J900_9RHOB|nr:hypothetical protein [Pseudooceanicola sediminis]KAA2317157.1 hypothetical protein E0K93_02295 [Puniceibacterium sp. HSS470]RII40492.1 hypothetical protein DL237_00250 [Pseudooceanicola sediminis]|tara:strand:- start:85341 stop:87176 length:1836 start_codon:yes stop_codon:yes gene_type:complete
MSNDAGPDDLTFGPAAQALRPSDVRRMFPTHHRTRGKARALPAAGLILCLVLTGAPLIHPAIAEPASFRDNDRTRATRAPNSPQNTPMSAIDWLNSLPASGVTAPGTPPAAASGTPPAPITLPGTAAGLTMPAPGTHPFARNEPPVSDRADIPVVSSQPLDAQQVGAVGLLPAGVTGLPASLWQASRSADVIRLIRALDVSELPAMQSLLYTLLLAEADPPMSPGDGDPMLLARLAKLRDLGAVDPALALVERAGPTRDPALFASWFDLSLLAGTETEACRQMVSDPRLAPDQAARIFCLAREGQWDTAALILDTTRALGAFDPAQERLLTRFLNADLDDDAVRLPPPATMSPLYFRLAEAIGEPLSTAALPRAYAVSDLRGLTGWKAELEAAERLAHTGALPENHLLGVYTDGRPSASGGIWDRVQAVQAFDRAITAARPDRSAVLATLPAAWQAMVAAELEAPFARLYAPALAAYADTPGPVGRIALTVTLLGPGYEANVRALTPRDSTEAFLIALASGQPDRAPPYNAASRIVAAGFAKSARPPQRLQSQLDNGQLGEAILGAMRLYASAMTGEMKDAADALATFRAVGLEDTARRAALQLLLLERRG